MPHPKPLEDVYRSSTSPFGVKSSTSPFIRSRLTEDGRDQSLVMHMLGSPAQSLNTCSGSQMIAEFMKSIKQRASHS